MGFEYQVKSICNSIRPDRQGMLFSATFPEKIQSLAAEVLQPDFVKIICGDGPGRVNENVQQKLKLLGSFDDKIQFVGSKYVEWTSEGGLLIFVTKKEDTEQVGKLLK